MGHRSSVAEAGNATASHDITAIEPRRKVELYPMKNSLATRTTGNASSLGRTSTRWHSAAGGCCTTGACSSSGQVPGGKTLAGRGRRDCLARVCSGVPAALGGRARTLVEQALLPASMHTTTDPKPGSNFFTCCLSQTCRNASHAVSVCLTAQHSSSQREGPRMA